MKELSFIILSSETQRPFWHKTLKQHQITSAGGVNWRMTGMMTGLQWTPSESYAIGPGVRAYCWRSPNQGRAHVELVKRGTSMTQRTKWHIVTHPAWEKLASEGPEGREQTERRTGQRRQRETRQWGRGGRGRGRGGVLAERVMSKREDGKEEEHLAWPGYLGKIAESAGDFLLCFCAVVTLLPCGAHGDNMCDEWRRFISTLELNLPPLNIH